MNKSFSRADLFGMEQQTPRTNGIRSAGGAAFMAGDCPDVMHELDKAGREQNGTDKCTTTGNLPQAAQR